MKRLIQQLLQDICHNQQQQIRHRRQLIKQHQDKYYNHKQEPKINYVVPPFLSDKNINNRKPKKAYHQGNSKYDITRRELYNWLASTNPTHFLTVQFPMNMRNSSLDVSKNNLRRLMARFEQSLIGSRWTKSHLPFYAFAEKGPKGGYTYHFHILFNVTDYTTCALQTALNNACLQLSLSPTICYLEEIETYEVIYYCLKGVQITNRPGGYDNIIPSSDLFNL